MTRIPLFTAMLTLLLAALVLAVGSQQSLAVGSTGSSSFNDPAADSGPGPDITSVVVSNDDAGTITFKVTTANRPAPTEDYSMLIELDTDSNASTGKEGSEFFLLAFAGDGSFNVVLAEHTASGVVVRISSSATGSYSAGVATVSVSKADLRNTSAFQFWVGVDDNPDDDSNWDAAPDDGTWSYRVATPSPPPPPLKLAAGKPAAMPGPAKAGGAFTVAMTVTRSDDKPFTGAVACTAKAGAATLRAAGRAIAGSARCTMRLPKTAKGKRLTGSITATAGTAKVAKTYGFAIR
jgi:hypothetical protein